LISFNLKRGVVGIQLEAASLGGKVLLKVKLANTRGEAISLSGSTMRGSRKVALWGFSVHVAYQLLLG